MLNIYPYALPILELPLRSPFFGEVLPNFGYRIEDPRLQFSRLEPTRLVLCVHQMWVLKKNATTAGKKFVLR